MTIGSYRVWSQQKLFVKGKRHLFFARRGFILWRKGCHCWIARTPHPTVCSSRGTHGQVFQHIVVDLCWHLFILNNLPENMIINHEKGLNNLLDRLQSSSILPKVPVLFLPVAFLFLVWVFAQPACLVIFSTIIDWGLSSTFCVKNHANTFSTSAKHQFV